MLAAAGAAATAPSARYHLKNKYIEYFFVVFGNSGGSCQTCARVRAIKETRFCNSQFYFSDHVLLTRSFIGFAASVRECMWMGMWMCRCIARIVLDVSVRESMLMHFGSMEIGHDDDVKVNANGSVRSREATETVITSQQWPADDIVRVSLASIIADGNERKKRKQKRTELFS